MKDVCYELNENEVAELDDHFMKHEEEHPRGTGRHHDSSEEI